MLELRRRRALFEVQPAFVLSNRTPIDRIELHGFGGSKLPALCIQELAALVRSEIPIVLNPLISDSAALTIVISFNGQTPEICERMDHFLKQPEVLFIGSHGTMIDRAIIAQRPCIRLSSEPFSREALWNILGILLSVLEPLIPQFDQSLHQRIREILASERTGAEIELSAPILCVLSSSESVLLAAQLFFGEDCRKLITTARLEDFLHGALLGLMNCSLDRSLIDLLSFRTQMTQHPELSLLREQLRLHRQIEIDLTRLVDPTEQLITQLMLIEELALTEYHRSPHLFPRSLEHLKPPLNTTTSEHKIK